MQKYTEISEDTTLEASREQLLNNDKTAISNSSAATAPSDPLVGQSWFDTSNNEFKVWNGTAWIATGSTDVATTTTAGLMSASDKSKLDGVATNANNYSHPNSGVAAGTYKSVTVNAQGHVTGGTNPTTLAGYGITDAINNSKKTTATAVTHTNYGTNNDNVPTMSFLSYWNGAYNSSGSSNLTYGKAGTLLGTSNYNSYVPTKTGTGASGTWGINISGNSATATEATKAVGLSIVDGQICATYNS